MIAPDQIFDCLIGAWSIERVITDLKLPGRAVLARMTGIGIFTLADPDRADYHEELKTHFATGYEGDAVKDYTFRRLANGFAAYFKESGELFHNMEFLNDKLAEATHLCIPDTYETAYQFDSANRFQVLHKVLGDRKQYEITSVYTRTG